MKNQETSNEQIYVAPNVEIIEIAVEQGFATSGNTAEDLEWNDEMGWE